MSTLQQALADYLALRRTLGYKLVRNGALLPVCRRQTPVSSRALRKPR